MIEKIRKYNFLIFYALFFISYIIGYSLSNSLPIGEGSITKVTASLDSADLGKIMLNNILIGIMILFGFLTFNLTNVTLFAFNGVVYGLAVKKFAAKLGLSQTLLSILPHGILELVAFSIIFSCSVDLNIDLYKYFAKTSDIIIGRRTVKKIIIGFILLIIAAIVETYLTPYLLNK